MTATRRALLLGTAAAAVAAAPLTAIAAPSMRERIAAVIDDLRNAPRDISAGAFVEIQIIADRLDDLLGQRTLPAGFTAARLERLYRLRDDGWRLGA